MRRAKLYRWFWKYVVEGQNKTEIIGKWRLAERKRFSHGGEGSPLGLLNPVIVPFEDLDGSHAHPSPKLLSELLVPDWVSLKLIFENVSLGFWEPVADPWEIVIDGSEEFADKFETVLLPLDQSEVLLVSQGSIYKTNFANFTLLSVWFKSGIFFII